MAHNPYIPVELDELANEVGEFICYWGFKKIHGRIWTHIYLSNKPVDAGQLMKRLNVSKALVSLSLSELLEYNVLLEDKKSERGTQTYIANPDVLDVILNVIRRRERRMLLQAETSLKMLKTLKPETMARAQLATERLDGMGRLIDEAQNALTCFLELANIDMTKWEEINELKCQKKKFLE